MSNCANAWKAAGRNLLADVIAISVVFVGLHYFGGGISKEQVALGVGIAAGGLSGVYAVFSRYRVFNKD